MAYTQLPLAHNTKFYVVNWNTYEVLAIHDTFSAAKKDARNRGFLPSSFSITGKMPVAFVQADVVNEENMVMRCLVYNPRFK